MHLAQHFGQHFKIEFCQKGKYFPRYFKIVKMMIRIHSTLMLLWALFSTLPSCTLSFVTSSVKPSFPLLSATVAETLTTTQPPSWEELQENLSEVESDEQPLVTLYRDTNGWCPFCERVWLALRIKGIPYQETLISLQNKPEWYKQLVPTTLVPAVLFHSDKETNDNEMKEDKVNERMLVWESNDILKALDDKFPDTPKLWVEENPEFESAMTMITDLSTAGIGYIYAGRNASLTESDIEERYEKFIKELDRLDAALADGPFRLGNEISAIDCMMIPTLERWRHQLPITSEIDILEGRSNIKRWFDTMDTFEPYSHRVMGDKYSWVAVASTFLRYFAGDESDPKVAATIARADEAAEMLTDSFAAYELDGAENNNKFVQEAANKLISNYEAIVKDCTHVEPLSQKHIDRASNVSVADQVLRYVASILVVNGENNILDVAKNSPLVQVENAKDGAVAARTVAARLCVPRDMSAPAATILRGVLSIVANRLEEQ